MSQTATNIPGAYYDGMRGFRLFRLAFGASQRLWPALAVRAAVRVFCSPLPPKWLNRRHTWDAGWELERWPFEDASVTLHTRAFTGPGPVALLAHGWGGHAGQMLPLALALERQGVQPVLVDLPAHGRSAGVTSNLPQFARALEYVVHRLAQQERPVRLLVAHSLGATAAAYAAARGVPAERLVLLAPAASPRAYTRYFAHMFGLSERTRAAMQQRVEAREGVLMTQFEPQAVGGRVQLPTLLVHDREDRVNRFADSEAFAGAIGGARLLATQGLGHRKILKDAQVIEEVLRFAAA
jgi:pimeloyl-ACP methyl ester carboxylesterase